MKRILLITLGLLMLFSTGGCITGSALPVGQDAAALTTPKPVTPDPMTEATESPASPEPTPEPLTSEWLCGTWKMVELKIDGGIVDLKATGYASYIVLKTDHSAVWDWGDGIYEQRCNCRWSSMEDGVRVYGSYLDMRISYDPGTDRLVLQNPNVDTTLYCYEKTDEPIPAFPVPSEVSKPSDGILGVWILQSIEEEDGDGTAERVNRLIEQNRYEMRLWFKVGGRAHFYYYEYDSGDAQDLVWYSYAADMKNNVIRFYAQDIETQEYPFTLDGDVLRIPLFGMEHVFVRNYTSLTTGV